VAPIDINEGDQVLCESFDKTADPAETPLAKTGIVTKRTTTMLTVMLPGSRSTLKQFHLVAEEGYIYERDARRLGRGWRIKL
jgi:hypothetical protein